jgi:prepilin signal peptidase PulO-like enzyme (type II secretory pathway)
MNFILSIPIAARLAILFLLGCCVGAVINLGIYRLAWYSRSISPWSRPHPKAMPRRWQDRVPVIGWMGLRRETKLHGGGFWIRPMALELLTGAAFALLYWWEVVACGLVPGGILVPGGFPPAAIAFAMIRHEHFLIHEVLFCLMLVAFWIDVDDMTIPDSITIPGTLAGLFLVTLWPYALLPDIVTEGPFQLPMLSAVWLTSPDEVPPPPNNPNAPPRFINPWDVPACTGRPALAGAIAAFCAWCLALVPGRWYTRHGYFHAVKVFTARMVREWATFALLALAVLGSAGITWIWSIGGPHWAGLASGLAGIAVGGGLVWIVRILASAVMHREAMGFGDVTLLAMIGAFLGWQAAVVVFFLAPLAAVLFGVGRLMLRGEKEIPYGPFLCTAAVAMVLGWPAIWGTQDAALFFWNPISTLLGWPAYWELGQRYFSLHWILIAVLIGSLGLMVVLLPPVHWIVTRLRPKQLES